MEIWGQILQVVTIFFVEARVWLHWSKAGSTVPEIVGS